MTQRDAEEDIASLCVSLLLRVPLRSSLLADMKHQPHSPMPPPDFLAKMRSLLSPDEYLSLIHI